MTGDQDIQATTRQLYDVRALYEGLADALAELGPRPLWEPDVVVVGARCANCGYVARRSAWVDGCWQPFPVRASAETARHLSQGPHREPETDGCGGVGWLLALEPVPDGTP